ncbi:hypothetical protein M8312_11920 [Sphingomonas sp. KRR8]|uniref:hypothetical protein n=1 Tax=Sphingomonas sp. KRR8 TaxID=2942996 RepID=UPI0020207175|nr:hypothetical protein [Sphingomonas sp. KRR8]URD60483.1 hypothetical protein M8312_11920 [Sphingomonas sp. KRR8]
MNDRIALGTTEIGLLPFEEDRLIAYALQQFPELAALDLRGQAGKVIVFNDDFTGFEFVERPL